LCQAVTETAAEKDASISADEFHALNRCLDVAIAGAVTGYQGRKDSEASGPEGRSGWVLANEMRGTLTRAKAAFEAIRQGTVGIGGSTAQSLETNLDRLERLIDQSLVVADASRPGAGSA
jgi:hypothetical protein